MVDESNRNYYDTNFLFSPDERIPDQEISGEEKVLNSTLIEEGFKRICNTYTPQHKYAIFSLCTTTRPYLKSYKWAKYNEFFGKTCDLIVISNGGIIPLEYMNCYPYMNYDAPHTEGGEYDELYKSLMKRRLTTFLEKFGNHWDKKIYVFNEGTRNWDAIVEMGIDYLVPGPGFWDLPERQVKHYTGLVEGRYPQLRYHVLKEICRLTGTTIDLPDKEKIDDIFTRVIPLMGNKGFTTKEFESWIMQYCSMYSKGFVLSSANMICDNPVKPTSSRKPKLLTRINDCYYWKDAPNKEIVGKVSLF